MLIEQQNDSLLLQELKELKLNLIDRQELTPEILNMFVQKIEK